MVTVVIDTKCREQIVVRLDRRLVTDVEPWAIGRQCAGLPMLEFSGPILVEVVIMCDANTQQQ